MSIRGKIVTTFQLIFSLIIGFYLLDIYLIIIRKVNKRKIENDILRAIIIMNNAFKSGKSTIQAVVRNYQNQSALNLKEYMKK